MLVIVWYSSERQFFFYLWGTKSEHVKWDRLFILILCLLEVLALAICQFLKLQAVFKKKKIDKAEQIYISNEKLSCHPVYHSFISKKRLI